MLERAPRLWLPPLSKEQRRWSGVGGYGAEGADENKCCSTSLYNAGICCKAVAFDDRRIVSSYWNGNQEVFGCFHPLRGMGDAFWGAIERDMDKYMCDSTQIGSDHELNSLASIRHSL